MNSLMSELAHYFIMLPAFRVQVTVCW